MKKRKKAGDEDYDVEARGSIADMANFVIPTTEATPKVVLDILAKEVKLTEWLNGLSRTDAEKLQSLVEKFDASKHILSDTAIRAYASMFDEMKEADNIL